MNCCRLKKLQRALLQCEGWELISPFEAELTPLSGEETDGYVRRGVEVGLKTRPEQYHEMFTHLVFECYIEGNKEDDINWVQYCGCFGSLVDCTVPEGRPSVRISREKVLKAHHYCEEVLAVELARLGIDPGDFLIFGSKARGMNQIPDYYCVEQRNGEYELPDLSAVTDAAEVRMSTQHANSSKAICLWPSWICPCGASMLLTPNPTLNRQARLSRNSIKNALRRIMDLYSAF